MILRAVKEHLIAKINAGSSSLDMKWQPRQIEAEIPSLRQEAILVKYNGSRTMGAQRRIEGKWAQNFTLTVDTTIQSTDLPYLIVNCPAPIVINDNRDGFIYVGSPTSTTRFYKAQTLDEINTLRSRGFINNGRNIIYIYTDSQLRIYGDKMLQSLELQEILADPLEKPGFDPEVDEYPISESLLGIMVDILKQRNNIAIQQPKDQILDQNPTQELRAIKTNLY